MAGTKYQQAAQSGPVKLQNFINGKFVEAASGKHLDSYDPSTGKVNCKVPASDKRDVDQAVQAAKEAFPAWSSMARADRVAILLRLAALLESELEQFAQAESADQGKPVHVARMMDIPESVELIRFFANGVKAIQTKCTEMEGPPRMLNYTRYEPVGVAGLISPWNFPIYLLILKMAPCIAVGNTCVCKPSELASHTAFMLCDLLNRAGVPNGVVNIVFGEGSAAGSALVEHPDVPIISFTGGSATGANIASKASPMFKKVALELGGKNPAIVFADADLERAVEGTISSAFTNNGQVCLCTSRLFVQRSILNQFVEQYVAAARKIKVGDPKEKDTFVTALNSKAHMDKVLGYIELAKQEGGKILCGGKRAQLTSETLKDGYFVEPTVITGLKTSDRCMQEEIFGPVVSIVPFDTEEEAVRMANGVEYGLGASVWTQNLSRAHKVAARIEAGTVWTNTWFVMDFLLPFGGYKKSGIGREGWPYSLESFTEEKSVCVCLD